MDARRKKAAAILAIAQIIKNRRNKLKKRKCWVRKWIARREEKGIFHNLFTELEIEDPQQFKNFLRMTASDLEILLTKVGSLISKQETTMRRPISPKERLVVTLRYLATGNSYHSLMYLFRIPVCTIARIVPEVCTVIFNALKSEYLQFPSTKDDWQVVADDFASAWNFPHCLGALDGKHIVMQAPKNAGSTYFNYKGTHSIVLMAVVDARYRFLYVDIGCNGRVADGGVFANTSLNASLEAQTLDLPAPEQLPGRDKKTPYVFVADDAFALRSYMMKPYPHQNQPALKRIFNYRLSRSRRVVENAFGILANRFRVLRSPICVAPKRVAAVTSAVCVLHNFLLARTAHYAEIVDVEVGEGQVVNGAWREEGMPAQNLLPLESAPHSGTFCAKSVREEFKEYFASKDGEVSWQYKYI